MILALFYLPVGALRRWMPAHGRHDVKAVVMALVDKFEVGDLQRPQPQATMTATLNTFDLNGETFIQIDGFGSATKQLQGKRSQNIRLGRTAALQLRDAIDRAFGPTR